MTLPLELTLPGDPVTKGRPRFTKYGKAYTPAATRAAEKVIQDVLRELVTEPYDGPVGVNAIFNCRTKRRTDGDNLMKMVLDAMNGIVFVDDYLVEEVGYRVYRGTGDEACTKLLIYALPTDA